MENGNTFAVFQQLHLSVGKGENSNMFAVAFICREW